jgi:hypothetical protein
VSLGRRLGSEKCTGKVDHSQPQAFGTWSRSRFARECHSLQGKLLQDKKEYFVTKRQNSELKFFPLRLINARKTFRLFCVQDDTSRYLYVKHYEAASFALRLPARLASAKCFMIICLKRSHSHRRWLSGDASMAGKQVREICWFCLWDLICCTYHARWLQDTVHRYCANVGEQRPLFNKNSFWWSMNSSRVNHESGNMLYFFFEMR